MSEDAKAAVKGMSPEDAINYLGEQIDALKSALNREVLKSHCYRVVFEAISPDMKPALAKIFEEVMSADSFSNANVNAEDRENIDAHLKMLRHQDEPATQNEVPSEG